MKIAHFVTMVSPQGEYGGPVRVALNQLKALQRAGHEVRLYATTRGFENPPEEVEGVPLVSAPARRVIPRIGFAGISSPRLLRRFAADVANYDVIHVHAARDLVSLPAARIAAESRTPLFLQTHGMIDPSNRALSRPFDSLVTRPTLMRARAVFYLTPRERSDLIQVGTAPSKLAKLTNGVESMDGPSASDRTNEVLFLARLHPRKRAPLFAQVAIDLASQYPETKFSIVGPDEGDGQRIEEMLRLSPNANCSWAGAIPIGDASQRMRRSRVYVLPAINEPFPMTVLEAAATGTPVIVTQSCGLAPYIEKYQAGIVISEEYPPLLAAVDSMLASTEAAARMGENARRMVEEEFLIDDVAKKLTHYYRLAGD